MQNPTPRQQRILDFIRSYASEHRMPPTRADIAAHFGIERASVQEHLQALVRKGFVEIVAGAARGLRLVESALPPEPPPFSLPLLGRIAAGQPLLAPGNVEDHLRIDPALFRPRADFLFRVQGHSMEGAHILHGDVVGIREQATADDRQIVAVAVEDASTGDQGITLKRFRRQGPLVTLLSENADQQRYAPIVIDTREQRVAILGLFAGLIRHPH